MSIIEKILFFRTKTPVSYGVFHIVCLIIVFTIIYIFCKYHKEMSDINFRKMLIGIGCFLIGLEIYKQILYSMHYDSQGNLYWDYQWYAFPFQFCSTPLYLTIIAGISKNKKIYNSLLSYLGTFGLFAGLAVMIYPNDVFTSFIGISIQSMIVHGSMTFIGFYILITNRIDTSFKSLLGATIVFVIVAAIALSMNLLFPLLNINETFNMFFISPYFPCTLPVLSGIYQRVPYLVFLLIYLVGFGFVSYVEIIIARTVKIIYLNAKERRISVKKMKSA